MGNDRRWQASDQLESFPRTLAEKHLADSSPSDDRWVLDATLYLKVAFMGQSRLDCERLIRRPAVLYWQERAREPLRRMSEMSRIDRVHCRRRIVEMTRRQKQESY